MRVVPTFLGVAAILGVAATAPAQSAVYRNGVPDGAGGATITDPYRIIDDFSFSSLSTVNGIRFWSLQESAFDLAGFEWTIFTDAAGAPDATVASGFAQAMRQAQGTGAAGYLRYQNDLFMASVTLAPGTYWLSLRDNAGPPDIFWETTASTTGGFAQYGQDDPDNPGSPIQYASLDTDLAFELTMTPEPASVVLPATGLLGVFGIARRQRRRA